MTESLRPCPACARHVRAEEPVCPFCRTSLAARGAAPWGRISAGVMLAMSASAALHACYGAPCTAADPTCGGTLDRDALADAGDASYTDTAPETSADAAPRPRGTINFMGTLGGMTPTAADIAIEATSAGCGGNAGVVIATSGSAISCGRPLTTSLQRPYLVLRASRRDVGTYNLVADGACTSATTDRVFTASWDGAAGATLDGMSGTMQITSTSADAVSGTFMLTLAGAQGGTVTGSFTATSCAR